MAGRSQCQAEKKLADPTTVEKRRAAAQQCESAVLHGIPTLVDEMDDAVNRAYAAWPDRLYLIVCFVLRKFAFTVFS